ncbi:hypothetical protein GPECTOR_13g764 [Gonium pectorale]|uniref:Uncharacterized protein n=1 Tax=Gonium pectorale TaxID=33097 RepID=A0A150GN85_GONPE|nr:hypothetical protein GPECTOR_13g764 [Gonium pectorale]|eukprot:KXZ51277.1 hypothetical protein GPECTOR_13g764 [Gonium pectorale]
MARDLLSRQRRHSVATPFHQAEWEGLVRGHSRCMAITTQRQPCSRAAAEAFLIYSYNHMQARGDSDDATALPALQAALCVCTQHGNSGFLAKDMGAAAEKVYPCTMDPETVGRVLNGMQTHRLTVCGKHFAGFHQVRPEDLRSTLSAGSSAWKGLMKQAKRIRAPKCAGVKANGNICTAAPRDVYVVQRSGGDGGGNGGGGGPVQLQCQPVLLFACGNHKLPTGRLYNPDAGQSVELSRLLLDHLANPDAADTAQLPGDLVPHAHDYP